MVEIKIQEKSYDIPTEWKDITLRYWCGLYSIINQYNKRDDEGNVIEAEHSEVELLKMNRDIFIYLTGVSHNEMNMLDVDSVNNAVAIFSQTLEEYKPKGIDKFEFEGEEYLFPKEFLRRNTFPNVFGENRGRSGGSKGRVSTVGLYNKFIKPYGWLNSLYMVAEKGVFRVDSENDIESVKKTDLYKVLTYLSWNTAKNDYEIAVQEKIHNKNNITL
mgnify:CR=1 FL=1